MIPCVACLQPFASPSAALVAAKATLRRRPAEPLWHRNHRAARARARRSAHLQRQLSVLQVDRLRDHHGSRLPCGARLPYGDMVIVKCMNKNCCHPYKGDATLSTYCDWCLQRHWILSDPKASKADIDRAKRALEAPWRGYPMRLRPAHLREAQASR